jgi:hypothetical protein
MSHTSFVAPTTTGGVIRKTPDDTLFSTLGGWTSDASWASATGSSIERANAILLFNDTETLATIAIPSGSWTLPGGGVVGSTLELQPFGSVVLVTTTAVPADPPYRAASGIDWRSTEPVTSYLGDDSSIFIDGFESGETGAWSIP